MEHASYSIQTYAGVTPAAFTKLSRVITKHFVKKTRVYMGSIIDWDVFAEIEEVSWDTTSESLTVKIIIYDFALQCRGTSFKSKARGDHNKDAPTERWMIDKILDALGRFENQPE
jgi:hypothetical protein